MTKDVGQMSRYAYICKRMYMYVVCVYTVTEQKEKGKVMSKVPGLIISLKLGKCESIMKERDREGERKVM